MLCTCVAIRRGRRWAVFALIGALTSVAGGVEPERTHEVLSPEEWRQLDAAVDHGLEFLIRTQREDGSFEAPDLGQPGITSLCVMAFLSRGHVPEEGPYGDQLARAIDFVLATQQDSGLLFDHPVEAVWVYGTASHTAIYNHAISGLMLGEVYGMTDESRREPVASAIVAAIRHTRERQLQRRRNPDAPPPR